MTKILLVEDDTDIIYLDELLKAGFEVSARDAGNPRSHK